MSFNPEFPCEKNDSYSLMSSYLIKKLEPKLSIAKGKFGKILASFRIYDSSLLYSNI
jgi:hypothetical protein